MSHVWNTIKSVASVIRDLTPLLGLALGYLAQRAAHRKRKRK